MILSNQVKCHRCGDEPFSSHVHHFQYCKCGAIAVDGGQDYLKRVGELDKYTDLSIEWEDYKVKFLTDIIDEAVENNRNSLGILCAVARGLRDYEPQEDQ